jgi:arylsulfatase A-like enzyme
MLRSPLRLLAILLAGSISLTAAATAAAQRRPNILFIFSDDHAYQAISAYRHSLNLVQTPNIDRLAREGMIFHRALVPNSICGPSRATVLTGKYSHVNGFFNNTNSRFDGSQWTFPRQLQTAGYQTALVGKWHLVSDPTGFDFWEILPGQTGSLLRAGCGLLGAVRSRAGSQGAAQRVRRAGLCRSPEIAARRAVEAAG